MSWPATTEVQGRQGALGGHLQQPPRAGEECKGAADSSVTTQDEAWKAGS